MKIKDKKTIQFLDVLPRKQLMAFIQQKLLHEDVRTYLNKKGRRRNELVILDGKEEFDQTMFEYTMCMLEGVCELKHLSIVTINNINLFGGTYGISWIKPHLETLRIGMTGSPVNSPGAMKMSRKEIKKVIEKLLEFPLLERFALGMLPDEDDYDICDTAFAKELMGIVQRIHPWAVFVRPLNAVYPIEIIFTPTQAEKNKYLYSLD